MPWIVYEAALVIENELAPGLSTLVTVVCEPELQVSRAVARDGLDETLVRQRLENQTDNATRLARADLVIHNDGSLEALLSEADRIFDGLIGKWGPLPEG